MVRSNVEESCAADKSSSLSRQQVTLGKFSENLAEVGSFSLSKPSWEPKKSLVQSDAAGASWGWEGSKETGKQALVS